jgi:hypothetical protein
MFAYAITNRSGAKFKKMERAGLHVMFYYSLKKIVLILRCRIFIKNENLLYF